MLPSQACGAPWVSLSSTGCCSPLVCHGQCTLGLYDKQVTKKQNAQAKQEYEQNGNNIRFSCPLAWCPTLPCWKIAFSGHFNRVSLETCGGLALLPRVGFNQNR